MCKNSVQPEFEFSHCKQNCTVVHFYRATIYVVLISGILFAQLIIFNIIIMWPHKFSIVHLDDVLIRI